MPVRENKWGKRQLGINKHNARRRDTPPQKKPITFLRDKRSLYETGTDAL